MRSFRSQSVVSVGVLACVLAILPAVPSAADSRGGCGERLLVLSAMPSELAPLLAATDVRTTIRIDGRGFFVGRLEGHDVILAMTRIGLVNARETTELALRRFRCGDSPGITGIVFSGVSGGRTYIGDVTIPARWTLNSGRTWIRTDPEMLSVARRLASRTPLPSDVPVGDVACTGIDHDVVRTIILEHVPRIIVGGAGGSSDPFDGRRFPCFPAGGDVFGCEPCGPENQGVPDFERFVSDAAPFLDPAFFEAYDEWQSAESEVSYDAVDMETAAVATVARQARIPFIAFRALSDGRGDPLMLPGFPFQFFFYRQFAADNAAIVALRFLREW